MSILKRSHHRGYWYVGLAQDFWAWSEKGWDAAAGAQRVHPAGEVIIYPDMMFPMAPPVQQLHPKLHTTNVSRTCRRLRSRKSFSASLGWPWPCRGDLWDLETHITKGTAIEITNLYKSIKQTKQQSMSWYFASWMFKPKQKTVTWNYCHPTTSKIISSPQCKAHPEKPVLSYRSIHFGGHLKAL